MFLALLIKLSKFLQQFSFLKTDSLCNVILYRQCLFTAYGHSKLLFDLCSVIHVSFFPNSSAFLSALFFPFPSSFFFWKGRHGGATQKISKEEGGHHILQELLVKSHQLPLNQTKNERSLMAMHCKDLKKFSRLCISMCA